MSSTMHIPKGASPLSGRSGLLEPRWLQTLSSRPAPVLMGVVFPLVAVVGWIDYISGFELSVSLLYLVPIALGTLIGGRAMGYTLAVLSAAVWLVADLTARHTYGHWFLPAWNTLTLGLSFMVVGALLGSLREVNRGLEAIVEHRTRALQAENAQRRQAEEEMAQALTDSRRAHAELQKTQFQLIEAAKMESAAHLATGVAHEVKNPLMTLGLGVDYFLKRPGATSEETQLAQDMKDAVQRASGVIDVLLNYARPRSLQLTPEDIHAVIENALTLMRHQLNNHKLQVVREFDPSLPTLMLDRPSMEHVFVNLFTNAMRAMRPGGTLTIRTLPASLPGEESDSTGGIIVEVDDTGHGILPEHLGRVFEPFFTTRPPGQGAGLGLSIVRKILEVHGGRIHLANRAQGGARATLFLNPEPKLKS